ncbi:MAG: hypothetical protein CL487_06575 [Acidobacteria bacterium]|nr:hypothetical protein [Acidobacteriota bacterium]|tara:strand:- start:2801 stop:3613 length:813 start_codon:yes stop_codon:yes gene_type:complete
MSALDIIIVSFNAANHLDRCLLSLHAHPPSGPHEVIVVDNASNDNNVVSVHEKWPKVRIVPLLENVGFAEGCNIGFAHTKAPLVLLLNPDTVVPEGALDRLVDALMSDDECAVAGPRLVDGAGSVELSWGPMLGPFNQIQHKIFTWLYGHGFPPVTSLIRNRANRVHFPDWVSGACLLVRRVDAEAVGFFDKRFFMYIEDVDFCAAIRSRQRRILFTPASEVQHIRGQSAATAPKATALAYRRSQLAFYDKHHPFWAPILRSYLRFCQRI